MSDEDKSEVRTEKVGQNDDSGSGAVDQRRSEKSAEDIAAEDAAAEAARQLYSRKEIIRARTPKVFAENEAFVDAASRADPHDPNIQPHENWRYDQRRRRL